MQKPYVSRSHISLCAQLKNKLDMFMGLEQRRKQLAAALGR